MNIEVSNNASCEMIMMEVLKECLSLPTCTSLVCVQPLVCMARQRLSTIVSKERNIV